MLAGIKDHMKHKNTLLEAADNVDTGRLVCNWHEQRMVYLANECEAGTWLNVYKKSWPSIRGVN